MKFIVSEKNGPHGILVVITDKDILGKKYCEGNVQLDLTQKFYLGEENSDEEVKKSLKKAQHIHLTGKHAVGIGINEKLVDVKNILYVQNVPHAEVVVE